MTDEQRSQTGWIGVQEWVVIFARALSFILQKPVRHSSLRSVEERVESHGNPERARADVEQHEHKPHEDDLQRLSTVLTKSQTYSSFIAEPYPEDEAAEELSGAALSRQS